MILLYRHVFMRKNYYGFVGENKIKTTHSYKKMNIKIRILIKNVNIRNAES